MRELAELSVYTATDNPFHDANLNQQFKWHKKQEREKKMGLSAVEAQARDTARRQEAKEELERLNRRRAEREAEQTLREEEEARMARLQESVQMAEWIAKDGDFQLEQERRRSGIRLKERRAKAIDFLALNLKYARPAVKEEEEDDGLGLDEVGLEIDLDEPYSILDVCQNVRLGCWFSNTRNRISICSKWRSYMKIFDATSAWRSYRLTLTFGL